MSSAIWPAIQIPLSVRRWPGVAVQISASARTNVFSTPSSWICAKIRTCGSARLPGNACSCGNSVRPPHEPDMGQQPLRPRPGPSTADDACQPVPHGRFLHGSAARPAAPGRPEPATTCRPDTVMRTGTMLAAPFLPLFRKTATQRKSAYYFYQHIFFHSLHIMEHYTCILPLSGGPSAPLRQSVPVRNRPRWSFACPRRANRGCPDHRDAAPPRHKGTKTACRRTSRQAPAHDLNQGERHDVSASA